MGMIKLPKESIQFFEEKYKEIFDSGELAERKWNTKASYASPVNSNGAGLFAILNILKQYR